MPSLLNRLVVGSWAALVIGSSTSRANDASAHEAAGKDWPYYHGSPAGTHYSKLAELHAGNVGHLQVAWVYDTQDVLGPNSTMESNPLIVDEQLFFVSPQGRLISLDAATGRERWRFDPGVSGPGGFTQWRRGVSHWSKGRESRIFFTFADDLYAIDAASGQPVTTFGSKGRVPLGTRVSSPGAVFKNLIILGGGMSEIRAFDVRTGALRWTFHTVPRPGEFGYDTWPRDAWKTATGANNWGGMSLDTARGIVYVPLAFAAGYYGARSPGDNLFANSVVALDARSGKRLWHFQAIRHDVWDRDLPAPPTLVKVVRKGKRVDALAQISKHGFVYVLDRETGESLFPLIEKPALRSDVPGERTADTQIEPLLPAPFARQRLTADMLTQRTPAAAEAAAAQFATLRSRGLWDPPSEQGTIQFPGMDGGGEWGGAAYDPQSGLLYVNSSEIPWILKLTKRSLSRGMSAGDIYRDHCAACHGLDRAGRPPDFPSLVGIQERMDFPSIVKKIATGGGRMPAFQTLAADQARLWPLIEYLQSGKEEARNPESPVPTDESAPATSETEYDYMLDGMPRFVDPDGYPAIKPPWGTLNAIDLNTGEYAWSIPLGEHPELAAQGLKETGSENYGGPIVTAGGLVFIGATSFDNKFRAYDSRTGKLLWETTLPAAGNATPSTYRAKGRQFVVTAAGGGRPSIASGSKIIAFALPAAERSP